MLQRFILPTFLALVCLGIGMTVIRLAQVPPPRRPDPPQQTTAPEHNNFGILFGKTAPSDKIIFTLPQVGGIFMLGIIVGGVWFWSLLRDQRSPNSSANVHIADMVIVLLIVLFLCGAIVSCLLTIVQPAPKLPHGLRIFTFLLTAAVATSYVAVRRRNFGSMLRVLECYLIFLGVPQAVMFYVDI